MSLVLLRSLRQSLAAAATTGCGRCAAAVIHQSDWASADSSDGSHNALRRAYSSTRHSSSSATAGASLASNVTSFPTASVRGFSSSSSRLQNNRAKQKQSAKSVNEYDTKPRKGDPSFRELYRRFVMKVHPDLFAQFPELQKTNDASLKKLLGVLAEARSGEKNSEDFMKRRNEELLFYVRTDVEGSFLRVPLHLRIPGGHCPGALASALAPLFASCGLPTRFHWGPEYWQSTYAISAEALAEQEAEFAEMMSAEAEYRQHFKK